MVTWLVVLTLMLVILIACMVGILFRLKHQDEVILRLSVSMLQFKQNRSYPDE